MRHLSATAPAPLSAIRLSENAGMSPLRNRVTPRSDLIVTPARGMLMGNRGLLHNDRQEIVRPFRGTRWIMCLLEFKGRRRMLMSAGQYTELFFLDEATALSAGHRPCAECRRADFDRFRRAWADGQGLTNAPSAAEIDQHLHTERWDAEAGRMRRWRASVHELPHGAFVEVAGAAHRVDGGRLRAWSPEGYSDPVDPPAGDVEVLTPATIVAAYSCGYSVN